MKWLTFVALCILLAQTNPLPDFIPSCKRNSSNLEGCIIRGIEKVRPHLKNGIREINMPAIEPFKIKRLNLAANLPVIKLKGTATNIVAKGGLHFKINSLDIDRKKLTSELRLTIPRLEITADYSTQGSKFWVVGCSGTGQFYGTFYDVEVVVKGSASKYNKDGSEYLRMKSLDASIVIGHGEMSITPDKNDAAGIAAASIIRTKANKILQHLRPVINKQASPIIRGYTNKVLSALPLDKVLSK